MEIFKYSGSTVTGNGNLGACLTHRMRVERNKNPRKKSDALCNHRMNVKVKVLHRTPAILYGAETWPVKNNLRAKFDVSKTKMLGWMCGVTKMDKVKYARRRGRKK